MIFEKQILNVYKKNICVRCDGNPLLSYFKVSDFPGLMRAPFEFKGNNGQKLQGYFYSYSEPSRERLIVFDHGMGGGHDSYMREIETIARRGYTVFAYDHTGCKESEGESTVGFSQSLSDLDHAIKALRAGEYADARISVIGHSWGGFAALNIPALRADIESCVSLAGFISPERITEQFFPGILKLYRPAVMKLEHEAHPLCSRIDARQTLTNTSTRVLYIASADDPTVKKEYHYDTLYGKFKDSENVEFLLVDGKKHNPNYTREAVALLSEMSAALRTGLKKKSFKTPEDCDRFRGSWDWTKMTEQDAEVWERIFDFIEVTDKK
ncbi:MAG: alpha/beta hydrolase family protein [Eubacteriales bacterium]